MALSLVLVFSVTRVIFIPQGEFVAFGALSMVMLQAGGTRPPCGCCWRWPWPCWPWRAGAGSKGEGVNWFATAVLVRGPACAGRSHWCWPCARGDVAADAEPTLVLITPLGPLLYRLVFRPLADASVLILLIVAVALHGVLVGAGLLFFWC